MGSVVLRFALAQKVTRKDMRAFNQPIHHVRFYHASQVQPGPKEKDPSEKEGRVTFLYFLFLFFPNNTIET